MRKILIIAAIVLAFSSCRKAPDYVPYIGEKSQLTYSTYAKQFDVIWNNINRGYVFWDVDKTDWDEVYDLVLTPSFFGERLIVIRDGDITALNEDDFSKLEKLIEECDGNRLAIVLTYEDDKKLKAKKYERLFKKVNTKKRHHAS